MLIGVAIVAAAYGEQEQQAQQVLELHVKASFLYTFGRYVEWPAEAFGSSTNTFVIGVLGTDPFGLMLDTTVAGKTIDGRAVRVQRFQHVQDVRGCQILFVGNSEKDRLPDIQAHLRSRPILTVSDLNEFLHHGGQIRFVTENNRVKFDINLEAAKLAGLKLDANLLRVARRVISRTGKVKGD